MASDVGNQMRIVVYYAIWTVVCAVVAGAAIAVLHTAFFSYHPSHAALWRTLFEDVITALAIAAGQGAVALVTGSILAQLGRVLQATVLLGLLIGVFDFVMDFVQMAVPRTELGWAPDLVILAVVTIGITALGSRRAAPAAPAAPAA